MIEGYCDSRFRAVGNALADNLSDDMEIGEAVAICVDGHLVVDLWGGYRDAVGSQTTERWHAIDALGLNNRMARGVRLSNAYSPFNGHPRSFGHGGIGGAVAFGDPDAHISFGFVTNRLVPGPGVSPYAQRLIDALNASL